MGHLEELNPVYVYNYDVQTFVWTCRYPTEWMSSTITHSRGSH